MALRMWSRGFDIFAPDEHVLYHRWARRPPLATTERIRAYQPTWLRTNLPTYLPIPLGGSAATARPFGSCTTALRKSEPRSSACAGCLAAKH